MLVATAPEISFSDVPARIPETMRALVQDAYGSAHTLRLEEVPTQGVVVMTPDQLIALMRQAFPQLAAGGTEPLDFLTLEQTAELLQVTTRTVRTWVVTVRP